MDAWFLRDRTDIVVTLAAAAAAATGVEKQHS